MRRVWASAALCAVDSRSAGGAVNRVRLRHASACVIAGLVLAPWAVVALASNNSAQAAAAPCTTQWGMYLTNAPLDPAMTAIRTMDNSVNRHSGIVHWYTQWGASWGTWAYVHPLFDNIRKYNSVYGAGATPLLTWEAWGPTPYTVAHNSFPLKSIAAGSFDAYIDSWANGLKAYGYPVMLDVLHEMDGNWYPWGYGVNGNTQADYIAAFRHIHDRFTRVGATNVKWVWNPDAWNPAHVDQRTFYPGDAYVDWMAIDVYNWGHNSGTWESLAQLLADMQIYNHLAAMSSKPMMFAEWGSAEPVAGDPAGVTKGQWIIDSARALATTFTRIKAAIWFSENGGVFALDSSANSIAGARTAFGGCGAPAPPPSPKPTPKPSPVTSPAQSPRPAASPTSSSSHASPSPAAAAGGKQSPSPKQSPKAPGSSASASASPQPAKLTAATTNEPGITVLKVGAVLIAIGWVGWWFLRFAAGLRRRKR